MRGNWDTMRTVGSRQVELWEQGSTSGLLKWVEQIDERQSTSLMVIQAQALFQSLNIPCQAHVFEGKDAHEHLLDSVEKYFISAGPTSGKVRGTVLQPIFLQRPQHSLLIVGLERMLSGNRHLVVFDPAYQPPRAIRRHLQGKRSWMFGTLALRSYRRDRAYLARFERFETLRMLDRTL